MTAAVILLSLSVHLGLLPKTPFYWHPPLLFSFPPQLWRLITPLLVTGPQLSIVLDTYWLYKYLGQLEGSAKFAKSSDLVWYLVFVGGVIQVRGFSFLLISPADLGPFCFLFFSFQMQLLAPLARALFNGSMSTPGFYEED